MAAAVTQIPVPSKKTEPTSRVVFTQGGKGGTGKTAFATMLVEWYAAAQNTMRADRHGHGE